MKLYILAIIIFISSISFSQVVEPFLEDIVSQFPNVRDIAMSQDQTEVVMSAQSFMGDISVLVSAKKIDNIWTNVQVVSFSGKYFDLEPFFSNDGLTLYFVSNRPLDQTSEKTKDFDIWYVKRETLNTEWSVPINIGAPINSEMDEFYPSITDSKNLYFTMDDPKLNQKDNIYISEYKDGNYETPKLLGDTINSDGYEFNAYVSKDESYIIYTCYNKEGGYGSGDLYLSQRLKNGNWGVSKNMGAIINSDKMDYCPFVDEDSEVLYFTSKRNSAKSEFENKLNLSELMDAFYNYENGLSRMYTVDIEKILSTNTTD